MRILDRAPTRPLPPTPDEDSTLIVRKVSQAQTQSCTVFPLLQTKIFSYKGQFWRRQNTTASEQIFGEDK